MYKQGEKAFKHHVKTYGPAVQFGYKDFIPQFKAEKFDAAAWAALFKEAGAKYVMPVAEHHDGFPMYASDLTDWTAAKMGPQRDVIGELAKAVRDRGDDLRRLHRIAPSTGGSSTSGMTFDSDVRDPKLRRPLRARRRSEDGRSNRDAAQQGVPRRLAARSCEMVDKYQPQLDLLRLVDRQPAFQPAPAAIRRVLLQPRRRVGQSRRDQLQEARRRSFPDRPACSTSSAASWRPSARSSGRPTPPSRRLRGATSRTMSTRPSTDRRRPDRHRQQERHAAAQHRAQARWHDPRGRTADAPRHRRSGSQSTAKRSTARGPGRFRRRPHAVVAGSFADVKRKPFTAEDIRFTRKGDTLYAIALAWPDSAF